MGARPLLLVLAASVALTACGPSLRRSHRASAYFEQCYAADLDPTVPDADRRACWQAWKRGYQIGASPERMDYVRERLAMLDPDRAAAIALATGDDGTIETIDTTDTTDTVDGVDDGTEAGTPVADSAGPPPSDAPIPEPGDETGGTPAVEGHDAPLGPTPSEVDPPDRTHAQIVAEARHQRAHERHLHRTILTPSTITPRCPCEEGWRSCTASCTADDHGCLGACRREHSLCSRSCY